ncbi:aminopeptidase N [Alkalilimnicola ehrlichii]|uniref:Aminopeptidase N n=1 Tax=Alkalilimnicola ehrlichii TaxID=351052 RepID=A0A3E0WSA8_9GAMM|nr:aminopeptidase N [Alkalilimnicola ehrlichii]RFA28275.1 aminopeptidase N [Alkalilimnicola ehrlichii]RFA34875.1 aminopeptidase N [Alkalilimnicola ehrlichii]
MTEQHATPVHRHEYQVPPYRVDSLELEFSLDEEETLVKSRLHICRNDGINPHEPLHLFGESMELLELSLDGKALRLGDYLLKSDGLSIALVPAQFTLEITTRLQPQLNTQLEGLYKSGGMFCTQCEAEGFRRITYFPDRPDVMSRYTTTVIADKARYPVLLSNGNPVERGDYDDGRHWVRWEDPFPKPSYLFALVAGDLACRRDTYVTTSGREVTLEIYTEHENIDKTAHAMASLKRSMRWDEEAYGLEYDLDIYMIVAVGDFNMGAMENKGLNIFNTQYVLASPDTATDTDFENVEAVIGHEYFHNWTGNRVTCRDWFQLSLKEGLTVFREQQFSAAMGSAAVKRINDVRILRNHQFPEDAGPMAHPVRPDSYIEINNFYTATVYNKGAEVIRMYHTLLGEAGFRRGVDLYFQRHDGQAVTCDDFLAAMADANNVDLSQFSLWYSQAGTPKLRVRDEYDPATQTYTLHVSQSCPPTPGQSEKKPFHLPLTVGLVDTDGKDLPLQLDGESHALDTAHRVLEIREAEQSFRFVNIPKRPRPSLLRGFSAPVELDYPYTAEDLAFLFAHDSDPFNRWEAGQRLMSDLLLEWTAKGIGKLPQPLLKAIQETLAHKALDAAFIAEAITPPTEAYLAEQMQTIDPLGIHASREALRQQLAQGLAKQWLSLYQELASDNTAYRPDGDGAGKRRLKNVALGYLSCLHSESEQTRCLEQFRQATNMTDQLAALALLADTEGEVADVALREFYERWQREPLVVDKWFRVQAMSKRSDALDRVVALIEHPAFELRNPNKVRALIGAFCQANPARFHAPDGQGYRFLADNIIALDGINPQIAARLAAPLSRWRRYDSKRQEQMKLELERILKTQKLSNDVHEIVSKSLAN